MITKLFVRPVCSILGKGIRSMGTEANNFVLVDEVGDKGILTLNRPEAFNATNLEMLEKLLTTMQKWSDSKSLIIVKGVPDKAFSAGGDLREVVANKDNPSFGKVFWKTENIMNYMVGNIKIPYIAFIDGAIDAKDELLRAFSKSKEGNTRVIKASIEKEQLTLAAEVEVNEDWEKDYKNLVEPLIEENTPCYIFFRLDSKSSIGYEWLLMSYTPDTATIRQKMLYASTKATMKKEFGSPHIKEEYHATSQRETTLFSYKMHKKAVSAPAPLTQREEEMLEIRRNEVQTDVSTETRQKTLGGISCALTESAAAAIKDTVRGSYNYLQFKIDLKEEKIHLVKASNVDIEKLPKEVPEDEARYHIYLFKHTHEGDFLESYIFIYSMPGYKCPIKERMMYSSCKALFVEKIQDLGLHIDKKLEIDSGSELNEEYFQDELHPKTLLHRPQFAKPQGPKNRGAKRLTRPQASEETNEAA